MKCKEAQTQAALLIGNDLEPAALEAVRKHLGECVGCREHFERLSNCLEVLQIPPRAWNAGDESLWPNLSARLASPSAGQKPHRLSGWAPTLAVAAACTAMFWVASNRWPGNQPAGGSGGVEEIKVPLQPIVGPPTFDDSRERTQKEIESQRRRTLKDSSREESGTMRWQRPSERPIDGVVPVGELAR